MLPGDLVRRPRPEKDEDEDDLLEMQEQFLREKQVPSAVIVKGSINSQGCESDAFQGSSSHGQSLVQSSRHGQSLVQSSVSCHQHPSAYTQEMFDEESRPKIADNHDIPKCVLDLKIIERDVTSWKDNEWSRGFNASKSGSGFPKVTKYIPKDGDDVLPQPGSALKSRSFFARQFGIKPKGEYFSQLFLELIRVN